ncbi:superantigen-like protein SSL4 [Streptosporangium saharense]|uniref:hypothetical protein n=1 Tax=Streptosporangium saharense TaxID=1706840 RepID=UPI0036B7C526
MRTTRKTWVSAGVVGLVLAGGISVTAAASASRAEKVPAVEETAPVPAVQPDTPSAVQQPQDDVAPPSEQPSTPDRSVVSRDVNPDPGSVTTYWTEQRLQKADPFPMPEANDPAGPSENRIKGID